MGQIIICICHQPSIRSEREREASVSSELLYGGVVVHDKLKIFLHCVLLLQRTTRTHTCTVEKYAFKWRPHAHCCTAEAIKKENNNNVVLRQFVLVCVRSKRIRVWRPYRWTEQATATIPKPRLYFLRKTTRCFGCCSFLIHFESSPIHKAPCAQFIHLFANNPRESCVSLSSTTSDPLWMCDCAHYYDTMIMLMMLCRKSSS